MYERYKQSQLPLNEEELDKRIEDHVEKRRVSYDEAYIIEGVEPASAADFTAEAIQARRGNIGHVVLSARAMTAPDAERYVTEVAKDHYGEPSIDGVELFK